MKSVEKIKKLNNLNGRDWVKFTKSVWIEDSLYRDLLKSGMEQAIETGVMISTAPPRDDLKKLHPATFSEKDIEKIIAFFTKLGEVVLDPFIGSGTTAVVCLKLNRKCIGIELYSHWFEIARKRISGFLNNNNVILYKGDALKILKTLKSETVDFIITSPPYWKILNKVDHKVKKERLSLNLPFDYAEEEKHPDDLSNIENYCDFLTSLKNHFVEYYRVLKNEKYVAIIVSDFRHKQKYYMFHADVGYKLEEAGFVLQGVINLVQNNKKLYPYGYPVSFVPNIVNQFILIARKFTQDR
ncbi:DNA methyltransferase [Thermodesulfobacterium thermophilum]|uniref:DNA methyltransferase n=1 Tax=Thermodesulfobacterium thermophilum TaxID=886 RepID=UPI0003B6DF5A|nr:DNA methyltransferase [Thermodesulfobacterium thermophilum]